MMYTGKQLRALVMPLMFEQFLNVMVGMVDTLMVSKAGEAAVSGVALTTNINLLIIQVMAALATGGAVVCSQYNGRRDTKDATYAAGQLETVLFIFQWQQRLFVQSLESRCYRQSLAVWKIRLCTVHGFICL